MLPQIFAWPHSHLSCLSGGGSDDSSVQDTAGLCVSLYAWSDSGDEKYQQGFGYRAQVVCLHIEHVPQRGYLYDIHACFKRP